MGSSFSCHANVDSLSCPGEKSVISDAVEVPAEKLLAGMEKYVRDGKTATGRESKFEVLDKGDKIVTALEFEIPALFGGGSGSAYTTYAFSKEKLEMKSQFFQSKAHYEKNDPQCTHMVKIHSDPVKVEFWAEYYECRSSGLLMEKMLGKVLQEMGTSAKAVPECKSPSDSSKLSVLSEPIEDVEITSETFLPFFRKFIVETMQGTELPDNTIVEERGSFLDTVGITSKSFAKHELIEAENHVYCHEFGDDEAMTVEIGITHIQVHKAPFRIEQYNVSKPGRRAGDTQAKVLEGFLSGALKHMEAQG